MADSDGPDREDSRALVALSLISGLGPRKIRALTHAFGNPRLIFSQPAPVLTRIPGIGPQLATSITSFADFQMVDNQFVIADKLGARFVHRNSPEYPANLKRIYDPPPFLWIMGKIDLDWSRAISVVGTRQPSQYGERVARELTAGVARTGLIVVSGLAYGIDAVAHRATLDVSGVTVAVLGSGLDHIYPAVHRKLANAIVRNGCLISSFPFGAKPDAPNFPQRNRLISGISRATLVVEAYRKGGALLTAQNALDQNREVFAVPGSVHSSASAGTNELIKNGTAKLVQSLEDIFEELDVEDIDNRIDTAFFREMAPDLNEDERRILDALDLTPLHLDLLCREARTSPGETLSILLALELKGYVRQEGGNRFTRK